MQPRYFLNVKKSATGFAWHHRLTDMQEQTALAIAQQGGVDEIVARILAGRQVGKDDAAGFLQPTLRHLIPDPKTLTEMAPAAERLAEAARIGEKVAVFGDYDVDGAASSALLARWLRFFGIEATIHIPDRIFEGYGPNATAMEKLAGEATLIVTVDCGTNSADAITTAKRAGADVVVLDHHQPSGPMPTDALAVVNPNRDDDLSGQGHLCAAGVTFLALVAANALLRGEGRDVPDLRAFLDLVGLATVCDVVPLTGLNRAFVVRGLEVARHHGNPGIAALAAAARLGEPIRPFHFGYILGPRINAGGRIGDASLGARLLTTDDPTDAETLAAKLDVLNGERQAMEAGMLANVRAQAEAETARGEGPAVLIAENSQFHPGVVGILASRIKDGFGRPAFAIAFNANGTGTGSGRSIAGVDLGRVVREAVDRGFLIKGGGHAMAAGITINRDQLGPFRTFLEEKLAHTVAKLRQSAMRKVDGSLTAEALTLDLCERIDAAGPYGAGHPSPFFVLARHRIENIDTMGRDGSHLRLALRSQSGGRLQAVAFRCAETDLGRFLMKRRGDMLHFAGTLSVNYWNGQRRVQFKVEDAADIV
ncbi:single-stranded-DNA-specific exonuclease RecJ [Notoacmeibacter sp. MSK16QG-6]|uniref:single-stranded-DNA-specific exonuclease RecJ n=1 Tax=Notoacmeibacter sp. MSK16QG-6 TaxID=2957982 RepID=UPI00209F1472|nr:single-stranded-DNA-specific exonuclease RecJ [Notoacmeibacter sp. MSK16QG-6]MCP1199366.1 single-stranded-DNA-specific exonuclease RecJ [Notoacmeibacter sp. MSK16QG-6]